MRPPKFAIEVENPITSSIYLCDHPKFAIEAENSITSSTNANILMRPPKVCNRSKKLYYIINIHHQYTSATY